MARSSLTRPQPIHVNIEGVHPGQAVEIHLALEHKGVATELVLCPRGTHGISEGAHRTDLYRRQFDWFDRYVK